MTCWENLDYKIYEASRLDHDQQTPIGAAQFRSTLLAKAYTVDSRYLKLGYLEFCETRNVYLNQKYILLNQKYILIAFSNHNLALETFLQVQITRSAN